MDGPTSEREGKWCSLVRCRNFEIFANVVGNFVGRAGIAAVAEGPVHSRDGKAMHICTRIHMEMYA